MKRRALIANGTRMERTQRAWLRGVSIAATVVSFDSGAVPVAVGQIGGSFHLDVARALWVPAATLLAIAVLLPALGRVADRYGRLRLYGAGVTMIAAASVLSASAPTYWLLLLARVVQGAGSAFIVATSAALAVQALPGSLRGRALGVNTTFVYLGTTIGPPVAGVVVATLGWRALFALTSLAALSCLALTWRLARVQSHLTEGDHTTSNTEHGGRMSRTAALLLVPVGCGQTALLVVLTAGPVWGWTSIPSACLFVCAGMLLGGAAFVQVLRRDGMTDGGIWRGNRLLQHAVVAAFLMYVAVHATAVLTALLLTLAHDRPTWQTGLILLLQPVAMVLVAGPAGRLYDRLGSRVLTTVGQLTVCVGLLTLSLLARTPTWAATAGGLVLTGVGLALFSTPNISAVLGSVRPSLLSLGTATLATLRFSGQTASVALLGAIVASGVHRPLHLLQSDPTLGEVGALATSYAHAMLVAGGIAAAGAIASFTRGPEPFARARARSASR